MKRSLRNDMSGGAMVELAIFTFAFVPLALYGTWFSDALHFGIKAQEASIVPVWDVTAHLLHDFANGSSYDALYSGAVQNAQADVMNDMQNSFDSADKNGSPISASVVARAQSLQVVCQHATPQGAPIWNLQKTAKQPIDTWVSCRSQLDIKTTGVPTDYRQDVAGGIKLFPTGGGLNPLTLCGIGPDLRGCGGVGFAVMNDDWGTEDGNENQLSIGAPHGNPAFFNVAQAYYSPAGNPGAVTAQVGGFGDLGLTENFRLSYRRTSDGSFSAVEDGPLQSSPLGGASPLHTGGPWHEESSQHPNVSQTSFSARTETYMGVPGWPADN